MTSTCRGGFASTAAPPSSRCQLARPPGSSANSGAPVRSGPAAGTARRNVLPSPRDAVDAHAAAVLAPRISSWTIGRPRPNFETSRRGRTSRRSVPWVPSDADAPVDHLDETTSRIRGVLAGGVNIRSVVRHGPHRTSARTLTARTPTAAWKAIVGRRGPLPREMADSARAVQEFARIRMAQQLHIRRPDERRTVGAAGPGNRVSTSGPVAWDRRCSGSIWHVCERAMSGRHGARRGGCCTRR